MIKINSLHELKKHPPTSSIVFVKTIKKLYSCVDGSWIEKRYFTTLEVSAILGVKHDKVNRMILHLGIRRRMNRSENMSYDDLKLLIKVIKIRRDNPCLPYKKINKLL